MERKVFCSKCGREVPANNNVWVFNLIKGGFPHPTWVAKGQHLTPVVEGDQIVCEGELSITQYLKGYPRDIHSNHYDPKLEDEIRRLYRQLQEL
ncbi:MAG: hypothetical protein WCV58_04260 [Patescibacteria group bacterium]|jgi:hypothetical protein